MARQTVSTVWPGRCPNVVGGECQDLPAEDPKEVVPVAVALQVVTAGMPDETLYLDRDSASLLRA